VACSAEHSVALTREGKVLTWGQGGFGRLGQANDKDYASPTLVESLKEHVVVSIAIGPGNTGVTTREFKAFVCGAGNSGQLGNNDIQPNLAFAQMAALQHVEVIRLAFGNRHILVVTKDGEVWTSGDNGFGQLGLGASAESKYLRPQRVDTLASIPMLEAACGDNVSFVLSRDGRLFAFGAGETNQIPGHQEDVHTPVQIVFPFDAEADNPIKASRVRELSVASINCAALADNGSVFTWGWALGETIQRVDYMYKEGFSVDKVAMGPSYMLFSV
jgi:alpha-tubulin suppressor-like RCC1 family protein